MFKQLFALSVLSLSLNLGAFADTTSETTIVFGPSGGVTKNVTQSTSVTTTRTVPGNAKADSLGSPVSGNSKQLHLMEFPNKYIQSQMDKCD